MNQASEDANRARMSFAAILGLKLIRFYQKCISPWLGANCRFQPTCSQYTFEAVEKYGFLKGCWMGFWRIMRCNPFSRGGNDPVK